MGLDVRGQLGARQPAEVVLLREAEQPQRDRRAPCVGAVATSIATAATTAASTTATATAAAAAIAAVGSAAAAAICGHADEEVEPRDRRVEGALELLEAQRERVAPRRRRRVERRHLADLLEAAAAVGEQPRLWLELAEVLLPREAV